jgi:hypothetical protein
MKYYSGTTLALAGYSGVLKAYSRGTVGVLSAYSVEA